jgi:hypothetical protein
MLRATGNTLPSRDMDVGGLHALITSFVTQVLHSNKFDRLINDLDNARGGAPSRALTIQATISGFMTRMKRAYAHFSE